MAFVCAELYRGRMAVERRGARICGRGARRWEVQEVSTGRKVGVRRLRMTVADAQSHVIQRTDDYGVLENIAEFFVDAFWLASTTKDAKNGIPDVIDNDSRRSLIRKQAEDLSARYGRLMGKRRLSSSFFIARNASGEVEGCVGVEVAVVRHRGGDQGFDVLSRDAGEQLFSSTMASMPAPTRNALRKAPLAGVATTVFGTREQSTGEIFSLHPVLSNLAVSPKARGSGLGYKLCKTCEDEVRSWNDGMFKDIWLIVEDLNEPAKNLYEDKLHYKRLWKDESAEAVRIATTKGGVELITVEAAHLYFVKDLSTDGN
mmetsp:Transcript_11830/g.36075  ORF Transcript_11830/g.36075 Transcript_11830/m.36075 type:complete len:316 (-) Transcript_11830:81-1028(-)|eukprot:CAMPEP_0198731074 /NCGR_PEP_ID=MMETSP1475-20131203/28002_1 /TAXON_ID= ORGANISM="Unidentified sp., Strain CCMP1999" /NCGR_SAMPLE_ID=MMETSP1475 /ASSEMBLY_ACC=CAM_ASM_001111 /LENGTH=315 /DNA_ID=CAMNT_0044493985 /DNA_START=193 /DNA_END=1140 /DNA_ORIENTATION=+